MSPKGYRWLVGSFYLAIALALSPGNLAAERVGIGYGVSVVKPVGWLTLDEPGRGTQSEPNQLLRMAKHPLDFIGINPSIHVYQSVLPDQLQTLTLKEVLETMIPGITQGYSDVTFDDDIRELEVSNLPAAMLSTTYTKTMNSGAKYRIRVQTVFVRRGNETFLFGMNSPAEGPDDARNEFTAFLDSVVVESD